MKPMIIVACVIFFLIPVVAWLWPKTQLDGLATITANDIQRQFPSAYCPDERYAVVPKSWLLNQPPVAGQYRTFNDCDKSARQFCADRHNAFIHANHHEAQALALGEFHYNQAGGGGHAVVVVFTDQGLIWVEPQTNREVTLTPEERASAYFVRF